ncbi:MAG: acyl-CoA dehydrogenase [Gemmatimonadetes bacterium]|nr:acyl-CoA dehydrogenase [Gemmatimonadota bacterium]
MLAPALDSDTLAELLQTIRRFVSDRLIPAEERVDREDEIPDDILAEMKAMGLYGITIPAEFGGLGLNAEESVQVFFELCRAAPAFRSVTGINNGLGSSSILHDGNDGQRAKYVRPLATGELIAAFCLTEPDSGSDAGALTTSAVRDGDHFVLNGTKRFITNAPQAGIFIVMARTDPTKAGGAGVSAFVVERETPGLSVAKPDRKMGQKGAHLADVIFDACRIPASAMLGVEGQGFKVAMRALDRGRIHIAAMCVGISERLIDEGLSYAMARPQFGKPIADFQLVQAMLADSKAETYAGRCMVLDAARRLDRGERVSIEASCAKMFASEACGRIADRVVQIHGGSGYISECAAERLYRDVRVFRLYEGTTQIQQLIIARDLIKSRRAMS